MGDLGLKLHNVMREFCLFETRSIGIIRGKLVCLISWEAVRFILVVDMSRAFGLLKGSLTSAMREESMGGEDERGWMVMALFVAHVHNSYCTHQPHSNLQYRIVSNFSYSIYSLPSIWQIIINLSTRARKIPGTPECRIRIVRVSQSFDRSLWADGTDTLAGPGDCGGLDESQYQHTVGRWPRC